MAKQDRLGTRKFCETWAAAGKIATVWKVDSKKEEDQGKSFVHLFQTMSGHKNYSETLMKTRISSYEKDLAKAKGVSAPKYPRDRNPSCVTYFSENPPD